ncbi:MAG: hypothetical protein ACD_9C00062G0007 [uncultured bacterium]|nr:MAG: hypothetical protein ACD_9C00062G0007 [uncultured bacterium]KKQ45385.1 MAG: hypothetical protein US63_C0018G0006 [Candidatus Moranbacteria bacterium GW2011_GWC2_37_8]KKQ61905.1 MAG: hypothetical protein US82_C0018G0010 [Parcubacteria group bacterium GW2011_GWC1_38_22]KKQ81216.1 MAG: hypothetical protein UT03_C0008G0012 [Candidatus Moranbacteria bacterium GW2011_GWD2_38_7]
MGKYLAVISNSIKKNLAYRANTFILMISVLFSFGVLFYFWNSIYMQGNKVGTYTLSEIISYYIFITIFELLFTSTNTAWSIGDEIRNGQITNSILKPMGYFEYKFSQSLGVIFYRMMLFVPVIALVLFLLRNYLTQPKDDYGYLFFIILSFLAFILNYIIYYIVGISSFWVVDNNGFFFTCLVVISFMQGQWMPLDLLPTWFVTLGNYLPFKYLFFVPVGVVSGRSAFEYSMLIIPLLWCVSLYFLAKFLYKKGIKKYEGYGV